MTAVGRQVRANLATGRRQALLVAITVVGAAALLSLALATFGAASDAYERLLARVDGAHLWLDLDPAVVDADDALATIRALDGVETTTEPRYSVATRLRVDDQQQWLILRDWPGEDVEVARSPVVDGAAPGNVEADAAGPATTAAPPVAMALDRNLADHLGVEVGDHVDVLGADGWRPVAVVGLTVSADMCPAPMCEPSFSHLGVGGLAALGLDPPPQPDADRIAVGIRLEDPSAHAAALQAAEAALPVAAVTAAWDHESMAAFSDFLLRIQSVFLTAFGLVAAVAAGLLIANAVSEAVRADTRRIGLLKAVGFTRAQLARVYLTQHLGVTLLAGLVGVGAGSLAAGMTLSGVAAQFGEAGGGLPWWTVPAVPALVVTIAALATWHPLRRATRVDVVSAVRTGSADGAHRRPARLLRLPVPLATALVDLRARPGRTLVTVGTLALAALTLTFASTVVTTLDRLAGDPASGLAPLGELTLERPEVLADAEVRSLLAAQPDIVAVQGHRWLQWQPAGSQSRYSAFAVDGDVFAPSMLEGRGFAAPGEVVVGYGLATHLDLEVGDALTAVVGGEPLELTVTGVYRELFNMGRMFRAHADTFEAAGLGGPADGYDLAVADGADPAAVAAALANASDDLLAASTAESFAAPVLDTLPAVMLGLSLVLAAIGLVGVMNSVWAGVAERTRELGLLVAVGMRGRQIVVSVLAAAAVMAVLGALAGIPIGIAVSRMLLDGLGRGLGFGPLAASAAPAQLIAVVPLIALVAVLGALLPARRTSRRPVIDALRAE